MAESRIFCEAISLNTANAVDDDRDGIYRSSGLRIQVLRSGDPAER